MKIEKSDKEWTLVADGNNSKQRMDGTLGFQMEGPDGQLMCVFEIEGKIKVETVAELQRKNKERNQR